MKGSTTVFVLILLGLAIGMYLMGYSSIAMQYFSQNIIVDGSQDVTMEEQFTIDKFLTDLKDAILSPFGLAALALIGIGSLVSLGGVGYASQSILTYLIPILLLFFIANIFFFPLPSLEAENLPMEIGLLVMVIYNALLILMILDFISGRQ